MCSFLYSSPTAAGFSQTLTLHTLSVVSKLDRVQPSQLIPISDLLQRLFSTYVVPVAIVPALPGLLTHAECLYRNQAVSEQWARNQREQGREQMASPDDGGWAPGVPAQVPMAQEWCDV